METDDIKEGRELIAIGDVNYKLHNSCGERASKGNRELLDHIVHHKVNALQWKRKARSFQCRPTIVFSVPSLLVYAPISGLPSIDSKL